MAAEAVVSMVAEKLADLLINEAIFLSGVTNQVEWIHGEFRQMKCFLKDADEKEEEGNANVKNWVADIRDVAYYAEDVIEQFIAQQRRRRFVKRYAFFNNNLNTLHKIGNEIERIKNKIREISDRRSTYGIENISGSRGQTSSFAIERQSKRRTSPNVDEPDVVGMENDVKELEARLIKEPPRRCVISIVGMGGVGKTTLAKRIYNSNAVKIHFDTRSWVYVSQVYNTKDLLQDIGRKVMSLKEEELLKMNEEELEEKLCAFLKERRYLIVMDDVWTTHVWDGLRTVFPDKKNGSRIVFTTRNKEVAFHADPVSPPHELQLLSDADSWTLFCKKVFIVDDNHQTVGTCTELVNVGKKIVKKCGGLPLAIVVLGGFLSRKSGSIREWSKVLERINWQLNQDQTQCSEILALSYNDLPFYIKSCFLYIGIFPEDSEISVERLIQLWISEGFVQQQRGEEVVEDIAEDYLEELIDRCMIQVARRGPNGSVKTCRIHDLLRDLSISKAKEVSFFHIHPMSATDSSRLSPSRVRRLVEHSANENYCSLEHSLQHIRSVLNFGLLDHTILFRQIFHHREVFRMLRVLDLGSGSIKSNCKLPRAVGKLIHLRYLRLSHFKLKILPSSISKLRNLQTLDLTETEIHKYDGRMISEMRQLRHLYLSNRICMQLEPPRMDGSSYCLTTRNLQTLCRLRIDKKSLVKDGWDMYTNLRKLYLVGDLVSQVEALAGWISKLDRLESLKLNDKAIFNKTPVERLIFSSKNHTHLYELTLDETWIEKLHHHHEFPPNLTNLYLRYCRVEEDPLPMLGKLPNLKLLCIQNLYIRKEGDVFIKEIVCLAGGFPKLQDLNLRNLYSLEEWRVEEGALPSLKQLYISDCRRLKMLPDGLRHVTTLQDLKMYFVTEEFRARVDKNMGEDWDKIAHVPSVLVSEYRETI